MNHDYPQDSVVQPLLKRLDDGDQSALNILLTYLTPWVAQQAHFTLEKFPRIRGSHHTGDLQGAVMVRLIKALRTVRLTTPQHCKALVRSHLNYAALDFNRRENRAKRCRSDRPLNEQSLDFRVKGPGPATQARLREELQHLEEGLTDEQKTVYKLITVRGFTQTEASVELRWSLKTVQRRWEEVVDQLKSRGLIGHRKRSTKRPS